MTVEIEILFWLGMLVLTAFLTARFLRRSARQHAIVDAELDESFEKHRLHSYLEPSYARERLSRMDDFRDDRAAS